MTTNTKKKTAVILFNLGGPTGRKTIYPFLVNFFMDRNILPLPKFFRFFLSRWIALTRSTGPALEAYNVMGGGSPLLENTIAQQNALLAELQKRSQDDIRVYTVMRYWHPMADSIVPQVQAFDPDELVFMSLYPQMSSTTFWSSLTDWLRVAKKIGYHKIPRVICCYPQQPQFISASVRHIREKIEACKQATGRLPRLLFSAHSLPVSIIKKGDPYEYQCKQTAEAILRELAIPELDYRVCYQSKIGMKKWLGPQTEDEIKEASRQNIPLIIYPHAFVSEHVETIVELGDEYRRVAEKLNTPFYDVVPTVGTDPEFITGLADMVMKHYGETGIFTDTDKGDGKCPEEFIWCCQRRAKTEHIFAAMKPSEKTNCCMSCGCDK